MNVNIWIGPGEVCTYDIRADCGLPSFFPEGEGLMDLKIMSIDYDDGDTPIDNITLPIAGTNREFRIPRNNEMMTWRFNHFGLKYLIAPRNWTFDSGILADGSVYHTV